MINQELTTLPFSRPPVAILGVPFDNVTCAEAVTLIEGMVASGRPHYLVTANVDFLVQAGNDVELQRILLQAHLVLCDGTPLVWASHFLGNPLPERVAGADLAPALMRVAAEKKYRVFLLGATPESAADAVRNLRQEYPGLIIAGHYSPPFSGLLEMDHEEIKRRVRGAKPDLLFVAFGCPKAEKWIAMHYRELGVPVVAGIGATIDFLAGRVKRAPAWIQRSGGEWIFRLAQEPRRLARRYGKDLWVFGRRIIAQWMRLQKLMRRQPGTVAAPAEIANAGPGTIVAKPPNHLDVVEAPDEQLRMTPFLSRREDCLLDLSDIRFIDSTGIALLARLQRRFRLVDRCLVLVAPSRCVRRALELMRLGDYFDIAPDSAVAHDIIAARRREHEARVAQGAPGSTAVAWLGEITTDSAGEVWKQTRDLLESPVQRSMVIDLAGTRFIDSMGLRIMLQAQQWAQGRGVSLMFARARPAVQNVLCNAGFESLLADKRGLNPLNSSPVLTA